MFSSGMKLVVTRVGHGIIFNHHCITHISFLLVDESDILSRWFWYMCSALFSHYLRNFGVLQNKVASGILNMFSLCGHDVSVSTRNGSPYITINVV